MSRAEERRADRIDELEEAFQEASERLEAALEVPIVGKSETWADEGRSQVIGAKRTIDDLLDQ